MRYLSFMKIKTGQNKLNPMSVFSHRHNVRLPKFSCLFQKYFKQLKILTRLSRCYYTKLQLQIPGRVAQLVMCLATDASLPADPGVASSILALSPTFVEIDHDIISTVILIPSAESFKKGCCQFQAKVLVQARPGKGVVR